MNDTPLVVERSEELPARGDGLATQRVREPEKRHRTDLHIETTHDMVKLYERPCRKTAQ